MSIVAYTGLPGSGKSYGVVESVILPSLEAGRTIVTNIPLKVGTLSDDYPSGKIISFKSDVDNEFFSSENMVAGAVYVIDEAWRWFPSGVKANQVPTEQKQFFTEHRHFVGDDGKTCEIVIVTQNLNQVAMYVKALVEETYISKKLGAVGKKNNFRIDVYTGVAEGVTPKGAPVRQLFGKYKKEIFRYYSSHTQNKTEYTTGEEVKVTDRTNIFKSWRFKFTAIFAPLLLIGGFYFSYQTIFANSGVDPLSDPARIVDPANVTTSKPAAAQRSRKARNSIESIPQGTYKEAARSVAFDKLSLELHPTARITGIYEKPSGNFLQVDDSAQNGSRFIPEYICDLNKFTESSVCVVDGYLVTAYSGELVSRDSTESGKSVPSLL
jgi:zona occludens toxin